MADALDYVVALSKKHYEEIGFLPRPRLEQYAQAGQLWTERENDELCGFMVWGAGWPILRVYQVCIQYDAQRREKGMRLVRRLIDKAHTEGYEAVSCFVADDIDANHFWRAAGFECAGQRVGGARRGRIHNNWVLRMTDPMQRVVTMGAAIEDEQSARCENAEGTLGKWRDEMKKERYER